MHIDTIQSCKPVKKGEVRGQHSQTHKGDTRWTQEYKEVISTCDAQQEVHHTSSTQRHVILLAHCVL